MSAPEGGGFLTRRTVAGVFAPALVFEMGVGAIIPIVPISAGRLGASLAVAGLLAAMLGIGQLLADLPAGALAARVGDRWAMLVAAGVAVLTLTGAALARDVVVLAVCVLGTGATNAVFNLARQSYLTVVTPPRYRARALSTLGGAGRIGSFLGPFLGAGLVHVAGIRASYWLGAGLALLVVVVVLAVPDVAGAETVRRRQASPATMRSVLAANRRIFTTLGVGVLMVGAVRGARQVVLPLWAEHLGLAPATTSAVFALAGAVDMLLFYPAGAVMDRFGRLWVAVPSMLVMGAALLALPTVGTVGGVAVVAVVLGFGNGIGSGVMMTLGADTAPAAVRSQFLGIWRLVQDAGAGAGPLVVSAGAALGSLGAGIVAMGVTGAVAAGVLGAAVPRWSAHANRRTRRAAGIGG